MVGGGKEIAHPRGGVTYLSNIIFIKIVLCLGMHCLLCSSPWYLRGSFIIETNNFTSETS